MKQHKWHKEILHWANGGEIESRVFRVTSDGWSEWMQEIIPQWHEDSMEYRIKPQPKEPQYLYVYLDDNYELSTIPLDNDDWTYIGRIKLEVEE